jgi:mRNA interferase RelE/StbE
MQKPGAGALSEYRIFATGEFQRQLEKLPPVRNSLREKLTDYTYPHLRQQPYFGINIRKLRGYTPDTWRYRIGRCRVFYTVDREERDRLRVDGRGTEGRVQVR